MIDVGKLMGALGGDSGPDLSFGLSLAFSNAYRRGFSRSVRPRLCSLKPREPVRGWCHRLSHSRSCPSAIPG
ncbi:hypothetical protein C9F09_03745 [Salmonella enterica subsp. enterica serovar Wilhelmsburg]|uniref:Uncharacterized protein n=1 Tax=Salmonella enterica subsp. enterica serovar Wilhelmsburg TaxID=1960126 RepID=A0A659RC94_SALET|nr:hypothetical protein C9F09_03745 [Salmonella enterica subsp. enterica serovar Wilhelmsburg]